MKQGVCERNARIAERPSNKGARISISELAEDTGGEIDMSVNFTREMDGYGEVESQTDVFMERPEEADLRCDMSGAAHEVDGVKIIDAGIDGSVCAAVAALDADVESIGLIMEHEVAQGDAEHEIAPDAGIFVGGIFGFHVDDIGDLTADVDTELEVVREVEHEVGAEVEGHDCGAERDAVIGTEIAVRLGVGIALDESERCTDFDGPLEDGVTVIECDFFGGSFGAFAGEDGIEGFDGGTDGGDGCSISVNGVDIVADACILRGMRGDISDECVVACGIGVHFEGGERQVIGCVVEEDAIDIGVCRHISEDVDGFAALTGTDGGMFDDGFDIGDDGEVCFGCILDGLFGFLEDIDEVRGGIIGGDLCVRVDG